MEALSRIMSAGVFHSIAALGVLGSVAVADKKESTIHRLSKHMRENRQYCLLRIFHENTKLK